MEPARFEFAATCFPTIQELLDKTGVRPDQISFVLTNSSLFNPTPSLSAMIVNHFKMGKRVIGYSLGGMGCSAGIIALDLAKELLELHPNSYALVVSHENITNNFYVGECCHTLKEGCPYTSSCTVCAGTVCLQQLAVGQCSGICWAAVLQRAYCTLRGERRHTG
jgi:3-ketoacyl-CoA synthase